MKKTILSAATLLLSAALFAQTSGTAAPAPDKSKASSQPNSIAVSDPGVPNKKTKATAAPAPAATAAPAEKEKPKGEGGKKKQGKGHHKK